MKPVGHYAKESKHCTSAVSVELGCYPSEKEATNALEKIMEHWDAIKEAEYYGTKSTFSAYLFSSFAFSTEHFKA